MAQTQVGHIIAPGRTTVHDDGTDGQVWRLPIRPKPGVQLAPETRFALDDVAAAHTHLDSGDNVGKVLLVVRP